MLGPAGSSFSMVGQRSMSPPMRPGNYPLGPPSPVGSQMTQRVPSPQLLSPTATTPRMFPQTRTLSPASRTMSPAPATRPIQAQPSLAALATRSLNNAPGRPSVATRAPAPLPANSPVLGNRAVTPQLAHRGSRQVVAGPPSHLGQFLPEIVLGKRILLPHKNPHTYLVVTSELHQGAEVAYRNTPNEDDKCPHQFVKEGDIVTGELVNGWLKIKSKVSNEQKRPMQIPGRSVAGVAEASDQRRQKREAGLRELQELKEGIAANEAAVNEMQSQFGGLRNQLSKQMQKEVHLAKALSESVPQSEHVQIINLLSQDYLDKLRSWEMASQSAENEQKVRYDGELNLMRQRLEHLQRLDMSSTTATMEAVVSARGEHSKLWTQSAEMVKQLRDRNGLAQPWAEQKVGELERLQDAALTSWQSLQSRLAEVEGIDSSIQILEPKTNAQGFVQIPTLKINRNVAVSLSTPRARRLQNSSVVSVGNQGAIMDFDGPPTVTDYNQIPMALALRAS